MQGHASGKARRQGQRGKGMQGNSAKPSQKAQKVIALAVSAWCFNLSCVLAPRLFCAFGSVVADPCICPLPLALAPLLSRLHCPRILLALRLFFPFAFRSHSVFILDASLSPACRVGVSGVGVSGVGVSGAALPACLPAVAVDPLPPPLCPLPCPEGINFYGCIPFGLQPLFNPLTYAVGLSESDC